MLNIHDLERRWLRYKIKSYAPYAVSLLAICIISFILVSYYQVSYTENDLNKNIIQEKSIQIIKSDINNSDTQKHEEIQIAEHNTTESNTTTTPANERVEPQTLITQTANSHNIEEKITLVPSLDFMKKIRGDSIPTYDENSEPANRFENIEEPKQEDEKLILQPIKIIKSQREESSRVNITRDSSEDDISHVIKRFKKNNNPALSLFIAKKYYEMGNYQQSYNYALMTNEINNNIEASWILFAKSLVKLNEREMAVKTLRQYIDHSKSNQAKILLDEIETGKFK